MGKIVSAYIMPHAPILISEIGRENIKLVKSTVDACEKIAESIVEDNPETIILSTPHAPCFYDAVIIPDTNILKGNLANFMCPQISFEIKNDISLSKSIIEESKKEGINAVFPTSDQKLMHRQDENLDHGATVPLYFVVNAMKKKNKDFKLVLLSTPYTDIKSAYNFGGAIDRAVGKSGKRIVYLASGDLSHRLTKDAPSGYNPYGKEYDLKLNKIISDTDIVSLTEISENDMQVAGECGTRSIAMMFGALAKYKISSKILSYEGPFGVGYLTAKITREITNMDLEKDKEHSQQVKLAKYSLENYILSNKIVDIPVWVDTDLINSESACFVSLHKNSMLRGCIGTITPCKKNLALEIIYNAISAGTSDPRFEPIVKSELSEIEYNVDVLENFEKVDSTDDLDVKRYGIVVSKGFRKGVLLPDLEGINNVLEQLYIALKKAGISPGEDYEIQRFEVKRYK